MFRAQYTSYIIYATLYIGKKSARNSRFVHSLTSIYALSGPTVTPLARQHCILDPGRPASYLLRHLDASTSTSKHWCVHTLWLY